MARTPQSTLTCTMRSSEHAAHRLLMHSVHTSHLWLKVSPCVSFHVIHACALVSCSLSVSPHPSFYFLVLFLFQLYLMSNSAPDEFSIKDPLCNSSLGSMVTLDYVTPLTPGAVSKEAVTSQESKKVADYLVHSPGVVCVQGSRAKKEKHASYETSCRGAIPCSVVPIS